MKMLHSGTLEIQVQCTHQAMNMFPRIGESPRIPSHFLLLYQSEFVHRFLFG